MKQRPVLACQVLHFPPSRTPSALNLHSNLLFTQNWTSSHTDQFSLQPSSSGPDKLGFYEVSESLGGSIEYSSCINSNDLNTVRNLKGICKYRPQPKTTLELPKRKFVSIKIVKPLNHISVPDEIRKTLVNAQKKKGKKRRVVKKRVRPNLLLDSLTNSISTESSLRKPAAM